MVAVDLPQVRAVRENQAKRAQALDEDETIPSDPYAAILSVVPFHAIAPNVQADRVCLRCGAHCPAWFRHQWRRETSFGPRRHRPAEQTDRSSARPERTDGKAHRSQIMRKMRAKSLVDLVRMVDKLGVFTRKS
jgi:hypothetical protein